MHLFDEIFLRVVAVDIEAWLPIARRLALTCGDVDEQILTGQQFPNSPEQGALAQHILEGQVIVDRLWIRLRVDCGMPEERLDLRGKELAVAAGVEVERLDAEVVPRREQAPPPPVVQQKGKHAIQSLNTCRAVFGVQPEDHFGIRCRPESVPLGPQLIPQFDVVVDLPVEHDGKAVRFHRLVAGGQVDDGQPLVIETQRSVEKGAFIVRSPVIQGIGHVPQQPQVNRGAVELEDADNAAH